MQSVDTHLPRLADSLLQPENVRAAFRTGATDWTPEVRSEPRFTDRPMAAAAVLIGLVQRPVGLQVLLTQRSQGLNNHAGQIAFPGGKADATDASRVATALREAQEEVGLAAQWVEVLGSLPTYITGSAYEVTPVLALIQPGFTLEANAHEVASVFEVPLAFLMDPANHRHHAMQRDGVARHWLSMPYTPATQVAGEARGDGYFIWGATAGMLRNLYRFLLDAGRQLDGPAAR